MTLSIGEIGRVLKFKKAAWWGAVGACCQTALMNPDKLQDTLASASSALYRDASQPPSFPLCEAAEREEIPQLKQIISSNKPSKPSFSVFEPKFQPIQL